jgi:hypothetical protein
VASRAREYKSVLWQLLGLVSHQLFPGVQWLPYEDIQVEFARQLSIAQTFGQNRSSLEEEGSNQLRPVEIKMRLSEL